MMTLPSGSFSATLNFLLVVCGRPLTFTTRRTHSQLLLFTCQLAPFHPTAPLNIMTLGMCAFKMHYLICRLSLCVIYLHFGQKWPCGWNAWQHWYNRKQSSHHEENLIWSKWELLPHTSAPLLLLPMFTFAWAGAVHCEFATAAVAATASSLHNITIAIFITPLADLICQALLFWTKRESEQKK